MGYICHVNHAQWHLRINVKTREQLPDCLFIDEHWEMVLCLVTAAEFSMITGMILSGFKSPRPTSWQCFEHCYWSLRQSRPICFSDTCFLTVGTTGMKWQICNCISESCPSPKERQHIIHRSQKLGVLAHAAELLLTHPIRAAPHLSTAFVSLLQFKIRSFHLKSLNHYYSHTFKQFVSEFAFINFFQNIRHSNSTQNIVFSKFWYPQSEDYTFFYGIFTNKHYSSLKNKEVNESQEWAYWLALQSCKSGHACHSLEVSPMCWTVASRAVQARRECGVARLTGAAPSWAASSWAAMTAIKIHQLSCELPFECRTWPTLSVWGWVAHDGTFPSVDCWVQTRVNNRTLKGC